MRNSEPVDGKLAAMQAYEADPYLRDANKTVWRLFQSSLDLEDGVTGVVVTDVSQTSEAFEQGITRGNVIVSVNRVPVSNVNEYRREMGKIKTGSKVLFRVINASNDTSRFVVITATEE